jgi:hypothetical protein
MNQHHSHETHQSTPEIKSNVRQDSSRKEIFKLALSATFHCLIGCGLGEVTGMIISAAIGLNNLNSILLSVLLGFIGGLGFGIIPLKRNGFTFNTALKTVIIGEGLSIVVMSAFEVLTELSIPGVMTAHLTDAIFWIGMFAALIVGFIAALPVNYVFVKRGIRHLH